MQDPRERPFERAEAADRAHEQFQDERSDFLVVSEAVGASSRRRSSTRNRTASWRSELREHFLSHRRMREWRDVHRQLAALAGELHMRVNETPATLRADPPRAARGAARQHRHARATTAGEYSARAASSSSIFPGSGCARSSRNGCWRRSSSRRRGSTRAAPRASSPSGSRPLAGDLVKRHYSDPHWEKERAHGDGVRARHAATGSRSCRGGACTTARSIRWKRARSSSAARWWPASSRRARRSSRTTASSSRSCEALEHKARRRDVLVDEETIYAFYDARDPEGIVQRRGLRARGGEEAERANPKLLFLTREYLMRHARRRHHARRCFPTRIARGGRRAQARATASSRGIRSTA